jgi:iron complex outermembrane recepter protein
MKGRALRETMLVAPSALGSAAVTQEASPTIEVVGLSSVAGSNVDVDEIPPDVVSVGRSAFSYATMPDLIQAMIQGLPSCRRAISPATSSRSTLTAEGLPARRRREPAQRIPVYQNGVCINEAYDDVANWDFIPEMAINRMALIPNNPLFGLNVIRGAFPSDMTNSFNYQGEEVRGRSFGPAGVPAQARVQNGNYSAYGPADTPGSGQL